MKKCKCPVAYKGTLFELVGVILAVKKATVNLEKDVSEDLQDEK